MNPVLRLVSGSSTSSSENSIPSNADEPTHEFVPGFQPRPAASPASVSAPSATSSSASLLQTGHLARCRRCGELNGRSAEVCWNCEAELQSGTLPTGLNSGLPTAANSELLPSLPPDLPVLTSSLSSEDLRSAHGGLIADASPTRRRATWAWPATIAAVLVLAAGGLYVYFDATDSEATARAAAAAARARAIAAPVVPRATTALAPPPAAAPQTPGGELSAVDAALRAADIAAQPRPEAMAVYVAPAERVIAASSKPKARAGSAAAARTHAPATRSVAPPPSIPLPTPVRAAAPSSQVGPCTPNVAALGLCSAPSSSQKKE